MSDAVHDAREHRATAPRFLLVLAWVLLVHGTAAYVAIVSLRTVRGLTGLALAAVAVGCLVQVVLVGMALFALLDTRAAEPASQLGPISEAVPSRRVRVRAGAARAGAPIVRGRESFGDRVIGGALLLGMAVVLGFTVAVPVTLGLFGEQVYRSAVMVERPGEVVSTEQYALPRRKGSTRTTYGTIAGVRLADGSVAAIDRSKRHTEVGQQVLVTVDPRGWARPGVADSRANLVFLGVASAIPWVACWALMTRYLRSPRAARA